MKQFYQKVLTLGLTALLFLSASNVMGQTTSQLGGGIVINEVLPDPNGANNFDTDGSGSFDTADEFVELYNASGSAIDITGWELWTGGTSAEHVFASASIPAGGYAVIISGISSGGDIANIPGDVVVEASGNMSLSNGSDVVIIYDPINDEHIKFAYNGSTDTDFESANATSTLIGIAETSSDSDGLSMSRDFDANTTFVNQTPTPGETNGAPPCSAPSVQATFAAASSITDNGLTLNPTRGNGTEGIIILAKEGAAVDTDPVSGTTYSANAAFGSGDELGTGNFVVYNGTGSGTSTAFTQAITSLLPGTEYHFAAYEYNTTDVCYAGSPAIVSATTTTSLDTDSNIEAPTAQVAAGNISSLVNAEGDAVDVFTFSLTDSNNGDAVATDVNTVVIEKATNNTVSDWSSVIAGAKLNDGTSDIAVTSATVNADNITFDLTGNEFSVASGTSEELTLSIYLTSSVTDGEVLAFEIPTVHSFDADALGSTFTNPIASAVTSNDHTIAVEATTFNINTVSTTLANTSFSFEVLAIDANNNVDLAARNISLSKATGSGVLASVLGLSAQAMVDGVYEWTDITLDAEGDYTISVDDDASALTATSGTITVLGNPFFTEEFDYTAATALNATSNWNSFSGAADEMMISSASLSYPLYPNTGTGNAVKVVEGGSEDLSATLPTVNSGSVYFSALVNVDTTNVKPDDFGEYFLLTRESGGSFGTRIYVKNDADTLRFGITKSSGSVEYLPGDYNYDETNLIVVKYTFNDGTTDDDVMDIWINPTINGVEPAPTFTHSATVSDKDNISEIALRQSGGTGDIFVDGIRVSTTWSELLPEFCTAPSTQASNVTFGTTDETSMVINWTKGDGDASLVLLNEGSAADADVMLDTDYTGLANSDFSAASVINGTTKVVYAGASAETVNVTGLTQGTTYHVAVIEYNVASFCYNLDAAAVGNNTTATPNDATSTVVEADTPIAAATIEAASATTEDNAVPVFNFKVVDDGATDSETTSISSLVINNTNATAWSSVLAGVKITDGNDTVAVTSITDAELGFDFSTPFIVENGGDMTLTILAWFNTAQTDGTELAFSIPTDHSFVANSSGSIFVDNLGASIASATHTLDVVATDLALSTVPTSILVGEAFGFAVTAEDVNGNVDTAARALTASATGTGALSGSVTSTAMTDGELTYTDLVYDVAESFTVTVTDGSLSSTTASIEAVSEISGGVFFSEYFEGDGGNNKYVEIYNGTNTELDLSTVTLKQSNNGSGFDGHPDVPQAYSITLSGSLASGDVYIVYNGQADISEILSEGDLALSFGDNAGDRVASFNGDDALGLFVNDVLVDLIGDPTVDPGSSWEVAGGIGTTANQTLVRKPEITSGNTVALGSFGTDEASSEWIIYEANTVAYIGFFGDLTEPFISANTSGFNGNFGFVANGSSSDASSYSVSAQNLTEDLVITAPAGFELSLDEAFTSPSGSLNIAQTEGDVAETAIYVRFTPTAADGADYLGNITHVSAGASTVELSVSGTEGSFELSTIAEARTAAVDAIVKVRGIVTTPDYGFNNGQYYIQDVTGGINIFHSGNQGLVSSGDSVEIEGSIAIFNNLLEIEPSSVTVISSENTLPVANSITESGLVLEGAVQGTRVTLEGVSLIDNADWPTEAISAGSNLDVNAIAGTTNFIINIDRGESFYDGSPVPGQPFTITGILTRDGDDVLILPFFEGDIVENVDPSIVVNAPTNGFDFGSVESGQASSADDFTVSGSNLTESVSITASAGYQVSTSESSDFGSNLSLSLTNGSLTSTSVFVRFAPTANTGGEVSGSVTISSAGVDNIVIALTGTEVVVEPALTISAPTEGFSFGSIEAGTQSAAQSFTVSGENLTQDVTVSVPAGYELSLAETTGFDSTIDPLIIDQAGVLVETTIYVRFAPDAAVTGVISGEITLASGDLSEVVAVTGAATEPTTTANKAKLEGVKAYPNPTANFINVEITDNTKEFTYQVVALDGSVLVNGKASVSERIDISAVETGMYILEITQGQKAFVTRIIKD